MKRAKLKRKKPMSRRAKRTRNGSSGLWKRKADSAWAHYVHAAGGNRCIVGGACKGAIEAHHIISRSVIGTRHLPGNGVLLCSLHHKFSISCSPHGGPAGFFAWFEHTFPGRVLVLTMLARAAVVEGKKPDYRERTESLERELAKLGTI